MAGGGTQRKTKEWKEQVCSKCSYIKPRPVYLSLSCLCLLYTCAASPEAFIQPPSPSWQLTPSSTAGEGRQEALQGFSMSWRKTVTKVLAGTHEGNRAAFRWAAECSCRSGAGLKVRAQRLGLNHQFFISQKTEELPRHYLGPRVCPVRAEQRIHRMEKPWLWCAPDRGNMCHSFCEVTAWRKQSGWVSRSAGFLINCNQQGGRGLCTETLCSIPSSDFCFFSFFSLSKN